MLINVQTTVDSYLRTSYTIHEKTNENFIEHASTAPKMDHVYSNIKLGGAANVHPSVTFFESRLKKQ